jgi:hypothetical protein
MTEEVKRFEISTELEVDRVISMDNLSLEESARHQGDTVSEDKLDATGVQTASNFQ